MNEGALYKFNRKLIGERGHVCPVCADMGKACYRYFLRPTRHWIYVILPCHGCHMAEWDLERIKYPPTELSDKWVSVSYEEQITAPSSEVPED